MTREEAVSILIRERDEDPFMRTEYREQIHEVLNMAIEALEQEPILDKIRTKVAEEHNDYVMSEQYDTAYGLELALGIIYEYRGESEDKDDQRREIHRSIR